MTTKMKDKNEGQDLGIAKVRGFLRGQLIERPSGRIVGDTGWVENKATNEGLTNLARLLGAQAGSYAVGYAAVGTQTDPINMTQQDISGRTASFEALNLSTSGTCTLVCTASFASGDLGASCEIGAAALYKTDSSSSMVNAQTFATSQWNTNQDFNLTYEVRFQTA